MRRLACIFAVLGTLFVSLVPLFAGTVAAAPPGNQHFTETWQRTDRPVADLLISRTWMWGPEGRTDLILEPYEESPGGERSVQYFDKSRMEITQPAGDSNSIWYVTNGLLVVELVTGQMQTGDELFEQRQPANVPVAGDGNDPNGPTYATFGSLLDATAKPVGDPYNERLDRSGQITLDNNLAGLAIISAHIDEVTGHSIAGPFWSFMNSSGMVYENGQFVDALMFQNPLFATGRPITEAYWSEVLVAGTPTDVLMQCFERRCLTYNPSNNEGWQVEAGNVGIHYYEWRYGNNDDPGQSNPPPSDPGPGDPPPGNPPPGNPPPGNPPPGNPPPGNPPPGNPPAGEAPDSAYNVWAEGRIGGNEGPHVVLRFEFGESTQVPATIPTGSGLTGANDPSADKFDIYRQEDSGDFRLHHELLAEQRRFEDFDVRFGHRYCYFVVAVNSYGESAASETACADVPHQPAAPRLISPADGYTAYGRQIDFKWETVPGATGYVLCILKPDYVPTHCDFNAGSDSGHLVWIGSTTGEASVELREDLTPDGARTDLYWTVSACIGSAYDCGEVIEYRELHIDLRNELAGPTLISETVDPNNPRRFTFHWELVAGAERYVICAAEPGASCEFETGNYYKSSILGPTVDTYPLEISAFLAPDGQSTNLYWTAAACDADLNCVWQSNTRPFTVDLGQNNQLSAPNLLSPANGYTTSDSRVDLTWEPVPNAASYRVCLAYNAGNSCPNNPTFLSAYLDPSTTLWPVYTPEGIVNELEWTVAACDNNNDCVWQSQVRSLTVDRRAQPTFGPPALYSAIVDPNDPGRFTFSWGLVQGADRYIICVAEPGANCANETGNFYKSSVLGPTVDTYPLNVPLWLAPDGQITNLNWTVAACDTNLNCVWQPADQPIVVDRRPAPPFSAPTLGGATVDQNDPGRFVFSWNLVQGAERYIICVAVPGANCVAETGNYYKSSILGPTVDSFPMDIPLWLAPANQVTNLNWTVAACDTNLVCVWQYGVQPIAVDRT